MSETDKQIADLQAQIDRLTAQQPTPPMDPAAVAEAIDKAHQMREQNASQGALSHYTRDQLREMRVAAPDDQVKAIALRDARAPTGPSSAGTSGQVSRVNTNVGLPGSNTGGWRRETPLGRQPHISHVDRLMDEQDRRDKAELIAREEAIRRAEKLRR